ncbi:hypothetical protein C5S21_07870 [Clostridium perfringens]
MIIKKLLNFIKKKLKDATFVSDLLIKISFLIFFTTTFTLNKYIAFYLLALGLFVESYFIQKGGSK